MYAVVLLLPPRHSAFEPSAVDVTVTVDLTVDTGSLTTFGPDTRGREGCRRVSDLRRLRWRLRCHRVPQRRAQVARS